MRTTSRALRLIRISKAKKTDLQYWREGASLVAATGQGIDDLQKAAARARWRFAARLHREGARALQLHPPMCRFAVTRFYYAMYHAMRAVVYIEYDGDDHEDHRALHTKQVNAIPASAQWQNKLKDARAFRNQADYDPYPLSDTAWAGAASDLKGHARELLRLSQTYLRARGCRL